MATALERALRTARAWAIGAGDSIGQMAREFLALHEQVAELERERDEWKDAKKEADNRAAERVQSMLRRAQKAEGELRAADAALASARVEGARTALAMLEVHFWGKPVTLQAIAEWRNREYPATGEEPTRPACDCRLHGRQVCDVCQYRPAPPAVPEPPRLREALVEVLAHSVINGDAWVRRLAKRLGVSVEPSLADEKCENAIVDALLALASRPTASGEG